MACHDDEGSQVCLELFARFVKQVITVWIAVNDPLRWWSGTMELYGFIHVQSPHQNDHDC